MSKALAALIEADTAPAAGPEVAALYVGYLQSAAPLVCQTTDEKLRTVLASALEKLAAKAPDLARDVANYRAATTESLRWRERVAATRAAARQPQDTPSDKLLLQATISKPNYRGLYPPTDPKLNAACALGVMPRDPVGRESTTRRQTDRPAQRCRPRRRETWRRTLSAAPFRHRGPPALDDEIRSLKQSLLVTDRRRR